MAEKEEERRKRSDEKTRHIKVLQEQQLNQCPQAVTEEERVQVPAGVSRDG